MNQEKHKRETVRESTELTSAPLATPATLLTTPHRLGTLSDFATESRTPLFWFYRQGFSV